MITDYRVWFDNATGMELYLTTNDRMSPDAAVSADMSGWMYLAGGVYARCWMECAVGSGGRRVEVSEKFGQRGLWIGYNDSWDSGRDQCRELRHDNASADLVAFGEIEIPLFETDDEGIF